MIWEVQKSAWQIVLNLESLWLNDFMNMSTVLGESRSFVKFFFASSSFLASATSMNMFVTWQHNMNKKRKELFVTLTTLVTNSLALGLPSWWIACKTPCTSRLRCQLACRGRAPLILLWYRQNNMRTMIGWCWEWWDGIWGWEGERGWASLRGTLDRAKMSNFRWFLLQWQGMFELFEHLFSSLVPHSPTAPRPNHPSTVELTSFSYNSHSGTDVYNHHSAL